MSSLCHCHGNIGDMKEIILPPLPNRYTGVRLFCKRCDRLFEVEKTDKITIGTTRMKFGIIPRTEKRKDHFLLPCGHTFNVEDIK